MENPNKRSRSLKDEDSRMKTTTTGDHPINENDEESCSSVLQEMNFEQASRIRALEEENSRMKSIIAEKSSRVSELSAALENIEVVEVVRISAQGVSVHDKMRETLSTKVIALNAEVAALNAEIAVKTEEITSLLAKPQKVEPTAEQLEAAGLIYERWVDELAAGKLSCDELNRLFNSLDVTTL